MGEFWFWALIGLLAVVTLLSASARQSYVITQAALRPQTLSILAVIAVLVAGYFVIARPVQTAHWVRSLAQGTASTAPVTPAPPPTPIKPAKSSAATENMSPTWHCPEGDMCIWNNVDGTGTRCNWDIPDPDWLSGKIKCRWMERDSLESAFNNRPKAATASILVLFAEPNNQEPVMCAEPGKKIDHVGPYKARSHTWTATCPLPNA